MASARPKGGAAGMCVEWFSLDRVVARLGSFWRVLTFFHFAILAMQTEESHLPSESSGSA